MNHKWPTEHGNELIHLAQDKVQKGCLREDSNKHAGFVKSNKIHLELSD